MSDASMLEAAARALEGERANRLFDAPRAADPAAQRTVAEHGNCGAEIAVRTHWIDRQVTRLLHRGATQVITLANDDGDRGWRLRRIGGVRWHAACEPDVVVEQPTVWVADRPVDDIVARMPPGSAVVYAGDEPWEPPSIAMRTRVGAADAHFGRLPGPVGVKLGRHLLVVQSEPDETHEPIDEPLSWFYDADYPRAVTDERIDSYDASDVAWTVALASQHSGPILDVGCGTGRLTVPLAQAGHAVTAIDLNEAMIAEMPQHDRIDARCIDAADLSLEERFSLVLLSFNMLLLVDDPLALLVRAREHLADGGRIAIDIVDAATLNPRGHPAVATSMRRDRLGRRYVRSVGYSAMDAERRFHIHGWYTLIDSNTDYPFAIDVRGLERAQLDGLIDRAGLTIDARDDAKTIRLVVK